LGVSFSSLGGLSVRTRGQLDLLALLTFHEGTRSPHRIFVATGDIDLLDGQLQLFFLNLLLLSLVGGRGSAPGQSDQDGH
jgi:hypothetical protein